MSTELKDILQQHVTSDCQIVVAAPSLFTDQIQKERVTVVRQLDRLESKGFLKRIPILGRLSGFVLGGGKRVAKSFGPLFSTIRINVVVRDDVSVSGLTKPLKPSPLYAEMLKIAGEEVAVVFDQEDMAGRLAYHRNSICSELSKLEKDNCIKRIVMAGRLNCYAVKDFSASGHIKARAMIRKKTTPQAKRDESEALASGVIPHYE